MMNKKMNKICSLIAALAITFTFTLTVIAVDEEEPSDPLADTTESSETTETPDEDTDDVETEEDIEVEAIAFDKSEYVIDKGDSVLAEVVVTPENAVCEVEFSVENKDVATVNGQGVITAIAKGTTKITAKYKDLTCEAVVTVNEYVLFVEEDSTTNEKFIKGFELGTTVSDAKEIFAKFKDVNVNSVKITLNSSEPSAGASVATGMIIEENGLYYNIVIVGDVNGDGAVTYNDTKTVIAVLSGGSFSSKAAEKAALVNGNKTITVKNALDISDYVRGKLESL